MKKISRFFGLCIVLCVAQVHGMSDSGGDLQRAVFAGGVFLVYGAAL